MPISQMFEHRLEPIKGWFEGKVLDKQAKLSSNVTFTVNEGRVVHLNASGEFEMGVSGHQMPIFLLKGEESFDVSNPGTTSGGIFVHRATIPAGYLGGLVATGGFELESTEYDTTPTYAPNDLLTADADNTTLATGGVLDNRNSGGTALTAPYVGGGTTAAIVGIVSDKAEYTNRNGVGVIRFWTYFLPAGA